MTIIQRFWKKTKIVGNCIIYTGCLDRNGYPKLTRNKKSVIGTRWIWEQVFGPIGAIDLMHTCDNPACVKLQHLEPGTRFQNMQDASKKGRIRSQHISKPGDYTPVSTFITVEE